VLESDLSLWPPCSLSAVDFLILNSVGGHNVFFVFEMLLELFRSVAITFFGCYVFDFRMRLISVGGHKVFVFLGCV